MVQVTGGWLEYAPENGPAGAIGYESHLEAAAEAEANQGQVVVFAYAEAQSQANGQNGPLWVAGVDGVVREG